MTHKVEQFLARNSHLLLYCADRLLEKKTLNEEEIQEMLLNGLLQFPSTDFDEM